MVLVVLSGCARVGPDYRRPDPVVPIPSSFEQAGSSRSTGSSTDRWWEDFGNPELNRLVDDVLSNNLDMKLAAARILEIQGQFRRTRADRFPSLGYQATRKQQHQTVETVIPGSIEAVGPPSFIKVTPSRSEDMTLEVHSYSLAAPVSFEIDMWGRLARAEEAARADLLKAEENRRTVAQSVVAEAIGAYLEIESYERRIEITGKSIDNFRRGLALVERRYERGLATLLSLKQARRALAQAEASLPPLRQELGLAQQKLAVLLGRYPKTSPPRRQPEDYFRRLAPVPAGLPSELLLRRPDVRSAEASLRSLNALIGVAKASRFPSISLTGGFGYSSNELDRLVRPKSELWNLSLNLAGPIFNAGKLEAGQRMAEARYRQGLVEYAKQVLTAFREVEGALLRRREQIERRERIVTFLDEARATQNMAETRYERGLESYLDVLEAQQTRYQAEESLVLADLAILTNRVTLHRALGGGWADPGPVDSDRTTDESGPDGSGI
ncbi:MAG: efflux transporter outer membrane subunit [Proteobacteria bacterium]|nr:efflux transporter outer membrane subunit [Pseudomonadota bacterium]